MNILYLISHLSNEGPAHALLSIVTGLRKIDKDKITILTLSAPSRDSLRTQFERLGVTVVNIALHPAAIVFFLAKIRRFLLDEKFEIAASTCVRADAVLTIASIGINKLKTVTTVQNIPEDDFGYLYPGWKGRVASWLHYQILKSYRDRIICCSAVVRKHLQEKIGASGKRILNPVVAPAVETSEMYDVPTIVYAASLSPRKNPEEAFAFLLATFEPLNFRLEVFGRGPLEAKLKEMYGDRNEIAWRGFTDNLAEIFVGASVYVSASRSEGFPLTPQLALIYGCPCVLSDIPQHQELAEISEFVYLYRIGDQADFSRSLRMALRADRRVACIKGADLKKRIEPEAVACEIRDYYLSL